MTCTEILFYIILGTLAILFLVVLSTIILTLYCNKYRKKQITLIFLGKLEDNQKDNIIDASKYLKLTNGLK